jgi:hypothetical protein
MAGPADRSCMDPTHDRNTRAAADRPLHPVQVPPRPRRRPHLAAVALAVLLVAAAVSAGVSFRNGRAWERRAGQQAARADGASGGRGGPLDHAGRVVGVIYAGETRTRYGLAIPVSTLRDLLGDRALLGVPEPCA